MSGTLFARRSSGDAVAPAAQARALASLGAEMGKFFAIAEPTTAKPAKVDCTLTGSNPAPTCAACSRRALPAGPLLPACCGPHSHSPLARKAGRYPRSFRTFVRQVAMETQNPKRNLQPRGARTISLSDTDFPGNGSRELRNLIERASILPWAATSLW